jgi:hypothetical protein
MVSLCPDNFIATAPVWTGPITTAPKTKRVRVEIPAGTVHPPSPQSSSGESFSTLRVRQVALLSAGVRKQNAAGSAWPLPSPTIRCLFDARHQIYKTYSDSYMEAQARMLFLLDLRPEERFERFEQECYRRILAPTTAHVYWVALSAVESILIPSVQPTTAMKRTASILEDRARAYPVAFPPPLTAADRSRFQSRFSACSFGIVALVEACWVLGQRFGDFIQLAIADFQIKKLNVMITVRRGKTVKHTQPYTLLLQSESRVTENLMKVRAEAIRLGWVFLTTPDNNPLTRAKLSHRTSALLSLIDERLEIRSIRRGGLQHMASLRHELQHIRLFSQHRSEEMLLRYLNWGQAAEAQNDEILRVSMTMTDECELQETLTMWTRP